MNRLLQKFILLSATFIVALPNTSIAQIDADRIAAVTCAVMAESRNMDSAFRVEKVNNARYDIGAEPYLLGDDLIKDSIALGTCELLVKNSSNWAEVHRKELERHRKESERHRKESERLSEFYASHTRMVILPNNQIDNPGKYTSTTITLKESLNVSKAFEGETIIGPLTGYYADCVTPHFSHQSSMGGWMRSVIENAPLCKKRLSKRDIYHSDYANNKLGEKNIPIAYRIKRKKDKLSICFYASGISVGCAKNKSMDDFTFTTGFVYTY